MTDKVLASLRFHGWDIALNHSAFVELDQDGNLVWWTYVIDKKTLVRPGGHFLDLPKRETKDPGQKNLDRLLWWQRFLRDKVVKVRRPHFTGIEDYALMTQSGAHLKGELGGLARFYSINDGGKLRLHDPTSIKMYIAQNGGAKPETVAACVAELWPETEEAWKAHCQLAKLDLFVAFGVAQMVVAEWRLRAGLATLDAFSDKERQVWNRCTKAYPVSILGRDWITQ